MLLEEATGFASPVFQVPELRDQGQAERQGVSPLRRLPGDPVQLIRRLWRKIFQGGSCENNPRWIVAVGVLLRAVGKA